jgi:hypothetical protein
MTPGLSLFVETLVAGLQSLAMVTGSPFSGITRPLPEKHAMVAISRGRHPEKKVQLAREARRHD